MALFRCVGIVLVKVLDVVLEDEQVGFAVTRQAYKVGIVKLDHPAHFFVVAQADANRNLGTALAAMGNVEEALTYLQRAVQLAPNNEFAKKELEDVRRRAK